ncbi:MAG: hypothetical protein ACRDRP_17600 [Pseudonocardiaceae bacterium]
MLVAAAQRYARWLGVPASEVVKARLGAVLAELYTEAGWSCYDSGVDATGCFIRALRVAHKAGDGFGIANAAWHAGATLVRSGHPNDALKCFQRFGTAEQLAVSAVRTYGEGHRRSGTMAELMLAELHVRAAEPRGLMLAAGH